MIVITIAAGLVAMQKVEIAYLKRQLGEAHARIGSLQVESASKEAQVQALVRQVADQNLAVDQLIAAGEARSKAAQAAIKKAQIEAKRWQGKYSDLLNAPPSSADECQSLSKTIDAYIELRRQQRGS